MTALYRMSYRVRSNIKIMALRCFDPYIILRDLVYQYVKNWALGTWYFHR